MKRLIVGSFVCVGLGFATLSPVSAAKLSASDYPANEMAPLYPFTDKPAPVVKYSVTPKNFSAEPTPRPKEPTPTDPSLLSDDQLRQIIDLTGFSETDARLSWKLSGVLLDLQEQFKENPAFGAAWNGITGTFSLNVRLAKEDEQVEQAIKAKEKELGIPINRHYGGMSYKDEDHFLRVYLAQFSKVRFKTDTDYETGLVTITTLDPTMTERVNAQKNPHVKVVNEDPAPTKPLSGSSSAPGASLWQDTSYGGAWNGQSMYPGVGAPPNQYVGWGWSCSGGASFRTPWNPVQKSLVTAAHCLDLPGSNGYNDQYSAIATQSTIYNGFYSQRWTVCGDYGDVQFHDYYQAYPYVSNLLAVGSAASPTYYFAKEVAGGVNPTMWTYNSGAASRVVNGNVPLTLFDRFGWFPGGGGASDCNQSMYGPITVGTPAIEGDSGGILINKYLNDWYLAGILHAVNGYETQSTFISWIFGQQNKSWWCTTANPC